MDTPESRHNPHPTDSKLIDWTRYPLLPLFIPFLFGIGGGYLCTVE
ncbi:MAG: hypothetical protein IJV06_12405 [Bacteroidaceae bacterium]|nr:hypothetical protein [Bacteroidaceae bacterium]MBQ9642340.1 hypothetical protein [Bacteroidaceae bacterium]